MRTTIRRAHAVVAGNGAHVPLDPAVMAKVTFTVQAAPAQ